MHAVNLTTDIKDSFAIAREVFVYRMQSLRSWMTLGVIILMLGFAGPFGSADRYDFAMRVLVWAMFVVSTYIGALLTASFVQALARRVLGARYANVLANLAAACTATVIVFALRYYALGDPIEVMGISFVIEIYTTSLCVAVIVNTIHAVRSRRIEELADNWPPIVGRLPERLRAPLVALSVADHYVEVHTTKGSGRVLMRLSDAIQDVGDTDGIRVHRSHWIATDHVQSFRREKSRLILTLTGGRDIPVSRTYQDDVRQLGLTEKAGKWSNGSQAAG